MSAPRDNDRHVEGVNAPPVLVPSRESAETRANGRPASGSSERLSYREARRATSQSPISTCQVRPTSWREGVDGGQRRLLAPPDVSEIQQHRERKPRSLSTERKEAPERYERNISSSDDAPGPLLERGRQPCKSSPTSGPRPPRRPWAESDCTSRATTESDSTSISEAEWLSLCRSFRSSKSSFDSSRSSMRSGRSKHSMSPSWHATAEIAREMRSSPARSREGSAEPRPASDRKKESGMRNRGMLSKDQRLMAGPNMAGAPKLRRDGSDNVHRQHHRSHGNSNGEAAGEKNGLKLLLPELLFKGGIALLIMVLVVGLVVAYVHALFLLND